MVSFTKSIIVGIVIITIITIITIMGNQRRINEGFSSVSFAKINLFLDVLCKTENGYHNINTLYTEIELCDTLKFSLTKKRDLEILSNVVSLRSKTNLIYRIGIYIQDKYSVQCGAKIELEKNIPISAGLGGGSSNGATTIKGLSELWGLDISIKEMHDIAKQFGSDINFFLEGFMALGKGRGEIIEPIVNQNDFYIDNILLVNPNFAVSSKEAYDLVNISLPNQNLNKLLSEQNVEFCFNKLEEGICKKYPVIKNTLNLLKENGAKKAILSGSGPTMIGFFKDSESCRKAQITLEQEGFWSKITSTRRRQTHDNNRR